MIMIGNRYVVGGDLLIGHDQKRGESLSVKKMS